MDCLVVFFIVLILIWLFYSKENYANKPYTTPYMNELISPYASFDCIYHNIPLEKRLTYTQT